MVAQMHTTLKPCWKFPLKKKKKLSLKALTLSANRIILEEKVDNVLVCQDLTVWASHKLQFALDCKLQYFRFLHLELERKAACYLCPNTQTYFDCHDMK